MSNLRSGNQYNEHKSQPYDGWHKCDVCGKTSMLSLGGTCSLKCFEERKTIYEALADAAKKALQEERS